MSFPNTAVIAHEVSPSIDLRWRLHGRPLEAQNKYFDWGGNRYGSIVAGRSQCWLRVINGPDRVETGLPKCPRELTFTVLVGMSRTCRVSVWFFQF